MLAHINTSGQHIAIYLDGQAPVGWGRDPSYPVQEGTFLGDIFTSPPTARYCGGRGYGSNVVAGRIGANQNGAPYTVLTNPSTGSTRCDDTCAMDPSGDGYTNCAGVAGNPITVWRKFVSAPALSFETSTQGFTNNGAGSPLYTTVGLSSAEHLSGTRSMLLTVNATKAGNAYVQLTNPGTLVRAGKNMTFFIKIPTGQNWDVVQPYAQDGAAKNYRWTSIGYIRSQIIPSEWTSVVVPIPSDFASIGSKIGVQIHMTGTGTTKVYVDSLFFDN
jgi:hypothetical protein